MAHHSISTKLTHCQRQAADFSKLLPIIEKAKSQQKWLYYKTLKSWYSPEGFQEEYGRHYINNHEMDDLLENLIIREPLEGNADFQKAIRMKSERYHREMNTLTIRGEEFFNKVFTSIILGCKGIQKTKVEYIRELPVEIVLRNLIRKLKLNEPHFLTVFIALHI